MKTAAIGVGHLGRHHARVLSQLPGVELVAVVDTDEKQANTIAKKLKTKALTNYEELIGKVDAVSIAAPTIYHYDIARAFLENGTHVLVEKPITKTIEQAEELVKLAHDKKLKFQVGHIERFNPAVMEILRRNLQPVFIEALRLGPFSFRSGDIGVVMDLMIHDIDIIRALVKSPVERIDAVGINLLGEHEDMANARITFECGCVANITASRASLKAMRKVRVFASDCYVSLDYGSKKGSVFNKPSMAELEKLNLQKSVPKKFLGLSFEEIFFYRILKPEKLSMKTHEPLYVELESFIHAIKEDTTPIVTGEDGLEAIRVAKMVTDDIKRNLERVKSRFKGQDV